MKNSIVHALISTILLTFVAALAGCGGSSDAPPASTSKPDAPKTPLIQKTAVADWCGEHGVPESICTRCNASLIADFKAKGDWCGGHSMPESQCIACNPEVKAKFEAMAPKGG